MKKSTEKCTAVQNVSELTSLSTDLQIFSLLSFNNIKTFVLFSVFAFFLNVSAEGTDSALVCLRPCLPSETLADVKQNV